MNALLNGAIDVATDLLASDPGVVVVLGDADDGTRLLVALDATTRGTALPIGSGVEVRRGAEPVRLARLSPAPFTDRLVSRFSLPVQGWRGWAAGPGAQQ